jgi:GAF domain-containing protein
VTLEETRLADAMATAAQELHEPQTTAEVLDRLVHAVLRAVPAADFAGVSIADRSGVHTMASTAPVVDVLDQAQYELQEGPCLDAMRTGGSVAVDDLRSEQRWPHFSPRALEQGVLAQMGIEIYHDRSSVGGLNLYACSPHAFDEETRHAVGLFVAHAALALDKSMCVSSLTAALQTRQTIGQAVGITMQRYGVDESTAFRYLVRISQHSNIKLRDVAQHVVDGLTAQVRSSRDR